MTGIILLHAHSNILQCVKLISMGSSVKEKLLIQVTTHMGNQTYRVIPITPKNKFACGGTEELLIE